jgi:hypothetical protein
VAQDQDLSRGAALAEPKLRAHVIAALGLAQDAHSSSSPPPFRRHHLSEAIHRGFRVAGRFAAHKFSEQPHHVVFAASQVAEQRLHARPLLVHGVGMVVPVQAPEPMHNIGDLQGKETRAGRDRNMDSRPIPPQRGFV